MAQSNISPIIRIGNLLGEKNAKRAGVTSDTSIVIAFIIGCIWRYVPSCANENGDDFRKRILITFFEIVRCISCSGIRGDIYLIMTQVGYVFFFFFFIVLFRDQVEIWENRGCETCCVYFAHLGPLPSL